MEIIILFLLTLINGIFALSEIALVSLKRTKIEQKAEHGSLKARIVLDLLKEPENFLSSVQVGITLIGVVAGAYGGSALADDVEPLILKIPALAPYAEEVSIVLIVSIITYFTIVIGELIPKSIALKYAERVSLIFGPFIKLFTKITYPIVKLLSFSTTAILRLLGIKDTKEEALTEDELRHMIKTAGTEGVIEREESMMHQNLFSFTEQRAKNLKTHRTEVEWIDIHQPVERISELMRNSAHARFLVCDGSIDNIQGVVAAKAFFESVSKADFDLNNVLQEPMYIPETMYALDILKMFKRDKQYLGIVVDEFGSVEGIVTLHDLMEAIVGDLPDVDEEDDLDFVERDDHSYLISGSVLIHQLNTYLGENLVTEHPEHYTTLGGFIISHLNKIPETGEKFDFNGYHFEIVDLDGKRIDKVIIKKDTADQELEENKILE